MGRLKIKLLLFFLISNLTSPCILFAQEFCLTDSLKIKVSGPEKFGYELSFNSSEGWNIYVLQGSLEIENMTSLPIYIENIYAWYGSIQMLKPFCGYTYSIPPKSSLIVAYTATATRVFHGMGEDFFMNFKSQNNDLSGQLNFAMRLSGYIELPDFDKQFSVDIPMNFIFRKSQLRAFCPKI